MSSVNNLLDQLFFHLLIFRVQLVAEFNKDSLRMLLQLTFGVVAHDGGAKIFIVYESPFELFWEALFGHALVDEAVRVVPFSDGLVITLFGSVRWKTI